MRLYLQEALELASHLNGVHSSGSSDLLVDLGPPTYRVRDRLGWSMDGSADRLVEVINADMLSQGETAQIASFIASLLKLENGILVEQLLREYSRNGRLGQRAWWFSLVYKLHIRRAINLPTRHTNESSASLPKTSADHIVNLIDQFNSDPGILEAVIECRIAMESDQAAQYIVERRRTIQKVQKTDPNWGGVRQELRALEIMENHPSEVELFFSHLSQMSDRAVLLAAEVFQYWIDLKLKAQGLSFRLVPDRLTSTYRMVPREACVKLDGAGSVELRLIKPRSLLSACFISFLTLQGISGRVSEWVNAVDLIDRLAFAGLLGQFCRCESCGRWLYVLDSRRRYCDDNCRYKVWAKTPRGRSRRREASALWRKRYGEEIRSATPKVRRGQKNH